MVVIIDRFEGDVAIVELPDKRTANLPKILLPGDASEGSAVRIELDESATSDRKKKIDGLMDQLWEKE